MVIHKTIEKRALQHRFSQLYQVAGQQFQISLGSFSSKNDKGPNIPGCLFIVHVDIYTNQHFLQYRHKGSRQKLLNLADF